MIPICRRVECRFSQLSISFNWFWVCQYFKFLIMVEELTPNMLGNFFSEFMVTKFSMHHWYDYCILLYTTGMGVKVISMIVTSYYFVKCSIKARWYVRDFVHCSSDILLYWKVQFTSQVGGSIINWCLCVCFVILRLKYCLYIQIIVFFKFLIDLVVNIGVWCA